jgi:hypothetical protein
MVAGGFVVWLAFGASELLGWTSVHLFFVVMASFSNTLGVWPFSRLNGWAKWVAILAGFITIVISTLGGILWVLFLPLILLRSSIKDWQNGERQDKINPKAWNIGIFAYYLVLSGVAVLIYTGLN